MPFSGWDDLNPGLASNLQAMINASGGQIYPTSGFRSIERQTQLWNEALRKYGDPEIADNWVARPGKSNHNHGAAVDLGFANAAARRWAHDNAARYGLHFPMEWEPWHIELIGSEHSSDRGAYTTPQGGFVNPRDRAMMGLDAMGEMEDPYDPGVQAKRLFNVISAGPEAMETAMNMDVDPLMQTPTQDIGSSGEPEQMLSTMASGADRNGQDNPGEGAPL
jgi:hypothetical protein